MDNDNHKDKLKGNGPFTITKGENLDIILSCFVVLSFLLGLFLLSYSFISDVVFALALGPILMFVPFPLYMLYVNHHKKVLMKGLENDIDATNYEARITSIQITSSITTDYGTDTHYKYILTIVGYPRINTTCYSPKEYNLHEKVNVKINPKKPMYCCILGIASYLSEVD